MEIVDLLEYSERAQLREWFEHNAASEKCCWIAMYRGKKKPEGECLPYLDVVEESLCFGWIDSTLKRLGDGRLAQRLSPRQKRSHWTELNKQRCADLESRGLMTDLGRAALQRANLPDPQNERFISRRIDLLGGY
jgi:uncharacterized protein YdeI (YjbR/CyaY-like superfamily)